MGSSPISCSILGTTIVVPFIIRRYKMRISAGMLLFALIDSGLAFFLVYYVAKAKFGGDQKSIARVMGAFLGTITFIIYFAVIVWFNTYPITAPKR